MDIAALTDTGRRRSENEDAYIARPDLGLFVVADGMGGHEGGEIASALACEVIEREIVAGTSLKEAILLAHEAILDHPMGGRMRGMGTTVVAVLLDLSSPENAFQAAWVGDSRIYQIQRDQGREGLVQVSHDHTPVQAKVDLGLITAEQARTHADRNIITQALGATPMGGIVVDVADGVLRPGETLLLCSDGLNSELEDAHIQDVLGNTVYSVEQVCQQLVTDALAAGGRDNVTVVVLRA